MDSEVESGRGDFVEALEDPTCLLQWKEIRWRGEGRVERVCTHLGNGKPLTIFVCLLLLLGLETFEVTSAHIL